MKIRPVTSLVLAAAYLAVCSCGSSTPSCEDLVKQLNQIRSDLWDNEEKALSQFKGTTRRCEKTGIETEGSFMHVTAKKEVYQIPRVAVTMGKEGSKFVFYCFECREKGEKRYLNILDRPKGTAPQRFWIELAMQEAPKDGKPGGLQIQQIRPTALDSSCPCEDKDDKKRHFAPPIR
jgi:hypothetical protein